MNQPLRLSGVIRESVVDGPGIRTTVFAQGCPHHCAGCHNPETHSFDGGYLADPEKILAEIQKNPLIGGVTFSGGEPFSQAKAFAAFALLLKKEGFNIVTYTGYTFEEILAESEKDPDWKQLLEQTDLLIDGRFLIEKRSLSLKFRGSSNQRVIDVKQSLKEDRIVLADI